MSTHTFQHDELFHEAGPQEALEYLWGRLQDRDLSGEEALALLGAVHRQLSAQRAGDPKVYFSYTRFMESLSREMPLVHDYVVAHWIENRRSSRRQPTQAGDRESGITDEDGQSGLPPEAGATVPSRPAGSFPQAMTIGGGSGEEPEEPGEPDEDDDRERDPVEAGGAGEQSVEVLSSEDAEDELQPDEADVQESESGAEDEQQGAELSDQEEASEAETQEAESEQADAEPEARDESDEDDQPEADVRDEADEGEAADEGAGEKPEAGEGEWPAEEQPEPAEPTEEMEGEGDEPSPED